jgi:predicted N-acetyltransferase YhbS
MIVPDSPAFDDALEGMLDRAFGPGRFAKVSERVREAATLDRTLSRVALQDDTPVGCCRIWRIAVGGAPALFLGPLAVDPAAQGEGLGGALVRATLDACDTAALAVLVVGQPRMFAPFGFSEIPAGRVTMPGPVEARRFQWRGVGGGVPYLGGAISAPRAAS